MEGTPKFLTIIKDANDWYVSITCEVEIKNKEMKPIDNSNIVGIDVGFLNQSKVYSD